MDLAGYLNCTGYTVIPENRETCRCRQNSILLFRIRALQYVNAPTPCSRRCGIPGFPGTGFVPKSVHELSIWWT